MRVQLVKTEGDKSFELILEDCTAVEAVSVIESVMIDCTEIETETELKMIH